MQLYLIAAPEELRAAQRYPCQIAHLAYRIGADGHLMRHNLLLNTHGGLLSLSGPDCPPLSNGDALRRELLRECGLRSFRGISAELPVRPDTVSFLCRLQQSLARERKLLFLPEEAAASVPGAVAVICTALSGGSFRSRMEEAVRTFGRIALDVQRLTMDFLLPSPTGQGRPLSSEALARILADRSPSIFYSSELWARYFTYTENGQSHFVVFDDGDTIRRKLQFGRRQNLPAAFLLYQETADLLPALFETQRPERNS